VAGPEDSKYGRISQGTGVNNKSYAVHRVMYELVYGAIPEGLVIDHVAARGCVSKLCCNPEHLEAVTIRENTLRGKGPAAQRAKQTHCLNGHELTESNLQKAQLARNKRICTACEVARRRTRYLKRKEKAA
jgi:hypothetical protein